MENVLMGEILNNTCNMKAIVEMKSLNEGENFKVNIKNYVLDVNKHENFKYIINNYILNDYYTYNN